MKKFKSFIAIALVLTLLMFSACGKQEETGDDEFEYKKQFDFVVNEGKPVTLVVDLNGLNPTSNTEPTEQMPVVFRSIQQITDNFMVEFPNVKVEWAYSKKSVGDWAEWMTTQISTDNPPSIVMMHGAEYADRNWFISLNDVLEQPNKFIATGEKGSIKWKDMFPNYMWLSDMTTNAANQILAIPVTCYPGTATAYFYNKDIFKELNLQIPTTWQELKEISEVINAQKDEKGKKKYTAIAPWSLNAKANVDVWDVQYSLGPTFAQNISDQWDYDGNGYMTQDEMLRAVYEGVFYGLGDNRNNILGLYNEVKYKYNEILDTGASRTDYEPLWNKGKVAMMEDGMWRLGAENVNTERKFEYGIFPTPLADSATPYAADFQMGDGAYNPPIAESYNICKQAVEKYGEGHKEACIAFLQWLTMPENINLMVDEKAGEYVGAVYNTIIPSTIEDFIKGKFARTPNANWTTGVTVSTQSEMSRALQLWVMGRKTDDEFFSSYDAQLYKGAQDMMKALNIDAQALGWKNGYRG